jgi:hypothetical protein
MPGWYVHMEAAKVAAQRLSAGDVPATLNLAAADATRLGDIAHTWRNYYAIGALGPDLFYLLPDYKADLGNVVLSVVSWLLKEWQVVDDLFVGSWEKWMGPVGANDSDLTAQLNGGLSRQLAQGMDEISAAQFNAVLSLISRLDDWFGKLTSGVPQGFGDSAFYWSDMFHYRHTFDFPKVLWELASTHLTDAQKMLAALTAGGRVPADDELMTAKDAVTDAETELAFALGWMTHCGTDVTGHPFTNAKCGGPFRLHWQRHHLVENHFDAAAYKMAHKGDTMYEELGTSALHFRIAFRTRTDAPYDGRHDAPMYDYFTGFPAYPLGETAIDAEKRARFFDVDPGELPDHLTALIIEAMTKVYGSDPKILVDAPHFSDAGSGRPNADGLNVMWNIAFRYLKYISSDGFKPRKPMPPSSFNEHPFPTPPGGALPAEDDGRGSDPGDDSNPQGHSFNIVDFLVGALAWIKYIGQVIEWLLTVVPGLALDVLTFPAREFLYYTVVAPLYSMYMASRRLLVLEGFLVPKPEEIEFGLITLGMQTGHQRQTLTADLNDPTGFAPTSVNFDEASGRAMSKDEWEVDRAFPRQTMKDPLPIINQALTPIGLTIHTPVNLEQNSHWVMPWKYPDTDLENDRIGWEPDLTHVGPWAQGDDATALLTRSDTDLGAARRFEAAQSPEDTALACRDLFTSNQHLGHPVDYSLYLFTMLADGKDVVNFNLDSDRGYGYHCWDYDRHDPGPITQEPHPNNDFHVYNPVGLAPGAVDPMRFDMEQPCTVPEQFNPGWSAFPQAESPPGPAPRDPVRYMVDRYRPNVPLHIHYLEPKIKPGRCNDNVTDTAAIPEVTGEQPDQAGMNPDGSAR